MKDSDKDDPMELLRQLLGGAPNTRKLHYTFAYEGLPGQFFAGTELVWPALKLAEQKNQILKDLWRVIGEIGNLTFFEPEGLKAVYRETDDSELVAVVMPPPKHIPEAYYCLILKDKKAAAYKYYTIEYSGSTTMLGQVFADGSRKSIQAVADNSLEACMALVLGLK